MSKPPEESTAPVAPSFAFQRLVVRKALFEEVARTPIAEGEQRPNAIEASINVSATLRVAKAEPPWGDVILSVVVEPNRKWQPYKIEVVVSGRFSGVNAPFEVFDDFCKGTAPSVLFPYARQIVHSLTADAIDGPIRIQPINVVAALAKAWGEPTIALEPDPDHRP